MSGILNTEAYQGLIDEDVAWLLAQPRTLERDHVEHILRWMRDNKRLTEGRPAPPVTSETSDEPTCPSCSTPWTSHLGAIGLCAALTELRKGRDDVEILRATVQGQTEVIASLRADIARLQATNIGCQKRRVGGPIKFHCDDPNCADPCCRAARLTPLA